VLQRQISTTCK